MHNRDLQPKRGREKAAPREKHGAAKASEERED
jgi:hypothetical protein